MNADHTIQIPIEWDNGVAHIKMGTHIHLTETEAFMTTLKEAFNNKEDVEEICVHVDAIEKISTIAIQAFISASRRAKADNIHLKWVAPSSVMVDAFSDLGLYGHLMKMELSNG